MKFIIRWRIVVKSKLSPFDRSRCIWVWYKFSRVVCNMVPLYF